MIEGEDWQWEIRVQVIEGKLKCESERKIIVEISGVGRGRRIGAG